jgi:transposase InsO family protein
MGIRDKPTAPASPWQNGFAERLIGSIRRESVDHMIVLSEAHLRRNLTPITTTPSERIDTLARIHRSLARYSTPVSSVHAPSWADFITAMVGFRVFDTHSGHKPTSVRDRAYPVVALSLIASRSQFAHAAYRTSHFENFEPDFVAKRGP